MGIIVALVRVDGQAIAEQALREREAAQPTTGDEHMEGTSCRRRSRRAERCGKGRGRVSHERPTEHRVVVGGGLGDWLNGIPVLDDEAVGKPIEVGDGEHGPAGGMRPKVHGRKVTVDQHPLDLERGSGRRVKRNEEGHRRFPPIGQHWVVLHVVR